MTTVGDMELGALLQHVAAQPVDAKRIKGLSTGGTITGQVSSAGALIAGSGFTPGRTSAGLYTVTFTTAFAVNPTVVATIAGAFQCFPEITVISTTGFTIRTITSAGGFQDAAFNFIAVATV